MKVVLRSCPRCQLVYEGDGPCPACQADPTSTPANEKHNERRKTGQVPIIRKPKV
jgi:hypothetical protein